ncbi:SDR family oxidoreductase [Paroceanicella profunda]|uniref:SDR family oxidoreductase n=1 Tax=Paroceanicella profunda TaxID=2579971 RepID=A0A5B8FW58_9RHOB|nr:SDR family oxidoreductase [Paroceanicella profunda]QDL92685.1 SDR family oxidoreductase [Paroceanicella profunda]
MTHTVLITGTSSGIGEVLAREMLDKGWKVIGLARRRAGWEHPEFDQISVDLLDPAAVAEVAEGLKGRGVSHVVHNAGLIYPNLVEDAKPEELAALTQLHLAAPLVLTQAVLPEMRAAKFGRIVFVTSRAAMGVPTRSAYSATKAGVHGMMRTWALELGPDGITVNTVAPGPILTDNFWGIVDKGSEREKRIGEQLPVRRLGTSEDVTRAVQFFADPAAGFVTGQVLFVCGGGSLGGLSL